MIVDSLGTLGSVRLLLLVNDNRFRLKLVDQGAKVGDEEGPGVEEKDAVHHDYDNAVPSLEASGVAVFNEEGVAQNITMVFITEENRSLETLADLNEELKTKLITFICKQSMTICLVNNDLCLLDFPHSMQKWLVLLGNFN